ncbi:MAG: hypothetical protein HQL15_06690 [Candidatus Omnitrophica bacterium]|nr:hypothetical protein [Candidatus Omnitrophota bacterium]
MSHFIKALRKAQEHRESEVPISLKIEETTPFKTSIGSKSTDHSSHKMMRILIALAIIEGAIAIIICAVTILSFSFNKNQVSGLMATIQNQEREIHNLAVVISKNKNQYDEQINNLHKRINETSKENKAKLNSLTVTYNDRYVKLKEEILDDRQQVKSLVKEVKTLKEKLQETSVSNSQTKIL